MDANSETSGIQLATYRSGAEGSRSPEPTESAQPQHRDPSRRKAYGAAGYPKEKEIEKGYLSGDNENSLPSIRAEQASSLRYREARGRGRDEQKESTPLLIDSGLHETDSGEDDEEYRRLSLDSNSKRRPWVVWYHRVRIAILAFFLVFCIAIFAAHEEGTEEYFFVSVNQAHQEYFRAKNKEVDEWEAVTLKLVGPFSDQSYRNSSAGSANCSSFIFICGMEHQRSSRADDCPDTEHLHHDVNCQSVALISGFDNNRAQYIEVERTLDVKNNFTIQFSTQNYQMAEFQVSVRGEVATETVQVIVAAVILLIVYILIGFDVVHRTLAAMLGSTCVLGVLSMLNKRPSLEVVVGWIDLETICLLFGMMTLVAIFSQTGFFDYSAVKMYKLARGKIWPLITLLCLFSAIVSAFLDNVTTILLLTPVSIRLCQVLNLDPRPVLIAEVVFSNVGGTATAIGDPPNVIIISNDLIKSEGINFLEFTYHLTLGIIFCLVVAYALLTVIYGLHYVQLKNKDPPHIAELKREIAIWERTARRLPVVSLEERAVRDALRSKANEVRRQLRQQINVSMQTALDLWQRNLAELEHKYRITNKVLLAKSSAVLLVVIILFFLANTIPNVELELGWIAIFGALVLLILADVQELETVLHKIEWATLLFFAGLFVLMKGLEELGLIRFIGNTMVEIIKGVPGKHQMLVAIILIVWVSALASSFIDNIPFTTATIPVIVDLAQSDAVCLNIRPLVWSLALGACLGGNGTLIGASANVVCAGIAEQNGYRISFMAFFKIGFPMMLVTVFTAMVYLIICHVGAGWDTGGVQSCVDNS